MIAEKTAGILERIRLVKDEAILDAVTNILDAYLQAQAIAESGNNKIPGFNPLDHYTQEEVETFEARDDFMGYSVQGHPVYATQVFEEAEREVEAVRRGDAKSTTLKEYVEAHNPVIGTRPNGEEVRANEARIEYARRRIAMREGSFKTVAQLREEKKTW